jgi:hypothetical protein
MEMPIALAPRLQGRPFIGLFLVFLQLLHLRSPFLMGVSHSLHLEKKRDSRQRGTLTWSLAGSS